MIQCKSHQSLWLIGHKQRDVQYITVQPQVIQEETDAEFDFIREQLLGFTGSGPAFIKVKISSIFKVTSVGPFEESGPVYLLNSLQNIKIMIARQGTLQYNVDMGNHRAGRLTLCFFGGANPPDERKEGLPMYVTYSDLIQIGIFIVALVGLICEIFKGRK